MKRHRVEQSSVVATRPAVAPVAVAAPRDRNELATEEPVRQRAVNVQNTSSATADKGDSPRAAYQKLREAAEAGDADAQFRLAQTLFNGPEAVRDEAQARIWLNRAAEQGHADAQFMLGTMYQHGRGVERDLAAARSWFQRAAASGHTGAQQILARKPERPLGRFRNPRQ